MLDRKGDRRQRDRRPGRRPPPEPVAPRGGARWLGIAVVVLVALIVVGRLQHDRLLPHSHCNDLKRKVDLAV